MVAPGAAVEQVTPCVAAQEVDARSAPDGVCSIPAVDEVWPVSAEQRVVACATVEGLKELIVELVDGNGARTATDEVVPAESVDPVGAGESDDDVVALRADERDSNEPLYFLADPSGHPFCVLVA